LQQVMCELLRGLGMDGSLAESSFPGQMPSRSHFHCHFQCHFVSCKVHLFQIRRRIQKMFLSLL